MDSQFVPLFCPDRYCPYKETGFYYRQSRYYDPTLGRFLNADSYASTGQGFLGYNMFAYCGNNPVNMCDPSGHGWFETLTGFFEKLYAAAEEAHKAAEERKKRFLEAYENTYGVTFESMVSYSDYSYSVSIETHYADKTASSIGISAGAMGAIFSEIPVPGSSFVGGVAGIISIGASIVDYLSSDTTYNMYVVDLWTVKEWYATTDGKWKGIVCGEKHMFKINIDNTTGSQTLDYLGAVNFAGVDCFGNPEPPCYHYYCNTDKKGIYR